MKPSARAVELAGEVQKDPRLVELILSESVRVVRSRPNVLIVEHRLGFVMANAGVDQSNVAPADGAERVLLLPRDPDGSAEALRDRLPQSFGVPLAVVITDSFGRAWRRGTAGIAIGAAGLPALLDLRGNPDLFGRTLQVSISGFADEIAAAASLVMGQGDEAQPVVLVARPDLECRPTIRPSELVRPRGRGHVPVSKGLVVALSGGVGGAKLALGLSRVACRRRAAGRRQHRRRFRASRPVASRPDIDTLTYVLAGLDNPVTGWGRRDETWSFMETHRFARRRRLVPPRRPRPRAACRAHAAARRRRDPVADHRRHLPTAGRRRHACCR